MPSWVLILFGYIVSCFVGHFVVSFVVRKLWAIAEKDLKDKKIDLDFPIRTQSTIAFWHGIIERGIYTSAIVVGRPEGIAVWLAFKAIMRWKVNENDPRHVPGSNIYMIGTALSVIFGVLGGFIAIGKWSLNN